MYIECCLYLNIKICAKTANHKTKKGSISVTGNRAFKFSNLYNVTHFAREIMLCKIYEV